MKERRKHKRNKRYFLGEVMYKGSKLTVTVKNLSKEGMGISLDEEMLIGEPIKITLLHEFTHRAYQSKKLELTFSATVIWTRKVSLGSVSPSDKVPYEITETEFETGIKIDFPDEGIKAQYELLVERVAKENHEDYRINE